MQILFTACSVVLFIGCLLAYTRATRAADLADTARNDARSFVMSARQQMGAITALDGQVHAVAAKLKSLEGRFYAARRTENDDSADRYYARVDVPANVLPIKAPVCENWSKALLEGPRSEAASCECAYCVGMRTQRRAEKAAILASRPKPVLGGE